MESQETHKLYGYILNVFPVTVKLFGEKMLNTQRKSRLEMLTESLWKVDVEVLGTVHVML